MPGNFIDMVEWVADPFALLEEQVVPMVIQLEALLAAAVNPPSPTQTRWKHGNGSVAGFLVNASFCPQTHTASNNLGLQ